MIRNNEQAAYLIVNAINKNSGYLKTIAFDLAKIDQDLSSKHPYKISMNRGKRK